MNKPAMPSSPLDRDALLELAAKIADAREAKMRAQARECVNWSAAQGERMRAADVASFIAEEIRALASTQPGEGK